MQDKVYDKHGQIKNNQPLDVDEEYELWWLMMLTRRAMYRVRAKELFEYGITPEESAVLFVIRNIGDSATPAEISRWILREPHSTWGLIDRMKKQGLVAKSKDLYKKNLIRVTITEKGEQAFNQATKKKSIHRIMAILTEEERRQAWKCLWKLGNEASKELGISTEPPYPPSR